ncbi:Na(+)/H(+) antiporter subunit C [Williamsia deligens]|uniref:Na(+)/H(+) antiporter subunit C n=1 Tax=Williamsia deligens TaxID=321325 RepID=A0ABW3G6P9_9NOCA|nr:Na(+)/H(+) antiporter subunit C [Williamsia deligens]MCP2193165.1 multicomponent Na+:H+ antiporter subunit C [Williamsia deligens]
MNLDPSPVNLGLLVVVGLVAACGVYMLLERSLIRMLLGLLLVGNAINLMIIVLAGSMGNPPIYGRTSDNRSGDADPLAQGMVLTAIVITMGVAAFVLSLAYRSFVINTDDEVDDDPEDVKVGAQSLSDAPDRDRSDDPLTGVDTKVGDMFDDDGNPLSVDEIRERKRSRIEADLMPEDTDSDNDDLIDDEALLDEDQSQKGQSHEDGAR